MGPLGCGKSTLFAVNHAQSLQNIRVDGEILLNGNILSMEPIEVRRRVGMVFNAPHHSYNEHL